MSHNFKPGTVIKLAVPHRYISTSSDGERSWKTIPAGDVGVVTGPADDGMYSVLWFREGVECRCTIRLKEAIQ